jgi:hypothetical protein
VVVLTPADICTFAERLDGCGVGVHVGVLVGVAVGCSVGVCVGISVGVFVEVAVAVGVLVGVVVAVGVDVLFGTVTMRQTRTFLVLPWTFFFTVLQVFLSRTVAYA